MFHAHANGVSRVREKELVTLNECVCVCLRVSYLTPEMALTGQNRYIIHYKATSELIICMYICLYKKKLFLSHFGCTLLVVFFGIRGSDRGGERIGSADTNTQTLKTLLFIRKLNPYVLSP